jgi:predicted chitinase
MTTPTEFLKAAMDAAGLDDNDERAGIAAICMGESRMFGHSETGYSHTSNDRIRTVFGERVASLSDERLDEIKSDDESWFNFIYSPGNHVGKMLGNTQPEDGYEFRGRGFIQLTGRDNYRRYGELCGHPEIVTDPDKANDPEIAAALAVSYIDDRWDGQDFASMMHCVGNNTPDIRATKEGYYEQFTQSGEYDYTGAPVGPNAAPEHAPPAPKPASLGEELIGLVETAEAAVAKLIP